MKESCCPEESALRAVLDTYGGPLAVAFSGGIDSRLLAFCAMRAGWPVVAVHASGPHIAPEETAYAEDQARQMELKLLRLDFNPLYLPGIADNNEKRCYFCKKALINQIMELLPKNMQNIILCDGSNMDDLSAYRPGMAALREKGVRSPLAEAGIGKATIRRIAALAGLNNPEQASRPCLLTRLAYGMKPEAELLRKIARAESAIAKAANLDNFRLRLTPAPVLQCPPLSEDQRIKISTALSASGFEGAELLEEKNISGFFDRRSRTGAS